MDIKIPDGWEKFFETEIKKPYFSKLMSFVDEEYDRGVCYPEKQNIFAAFEFTKPSNIKAVILGQDPYHEPNQAHGLCFSVLQGCPLPRSLNNIYKELKAEYGCMTRQDGCLEDWARQGVLMINTVMTVRQGEANSHKGHGWEEFTDSVISYVNSLDRPVVYMLWGKPAQKKEKLLGNPKQLILRAAHPSPLSASRGFFGCGHFAECNNFLTANGEEKINWL